VCPILLPRSTFNISHSLESLTCEIHATAFYSEPNWNWRLYVLINWWPSAQRTRYGLQQTKRMEERLFCTLLRIRRFLPDLYSCLHFSFSYVSHCWILSFRWRIKVEVLEDEDSIKTSNSMKRFLQHIKITSVISTPVPSSSSQIERFLLHIARARARTHTHTHTHT